MGEFGEFDFGQLLTAAVGWAEVGAVGFEGLAGVRPIERVGHGFVVVGDEGAEFGVEVRHGGEVAAADDFSHDDPKHRFDLVEPRAVFGQVYEANAVRLVA